MFSGQYYSKLKAILSELLLFPENYGCNSEYSCVSGNFTSFALEGEREDKKGVRIINKKIKSSLAQFFQVTFIFFSSILRYL